MPFYGEADGFVVYNNILYDENSRRGWTALELFFLLVCSERNEKTIIPKFIGINEGIMIVPKS